MQYKMAESGIRVTPLKVSSDLVRKCSGLSIDIGSSAAKFIYRTTADWEESKDTEKTQGTLHVLVCGREDIESALQKIKDEIYLSKVRDGKAMVTSVGLGSYQYSDMLEGVLDIELKSIFEMDCMCLGFHSMLEDFAGKQVCYPKYVAEEKQMWEIMKGEIEMSASFLKKNSQTKMSFMTKLPECNDGIALNAERSVVDVLGKEQVFPCMMAHLGSGYFYIQMQEDRTVKNLGGANAGGRYLLGVASLLTGCKSYDEFIDLAERGDSTNVDEHKNSLANRRKPQGQANKDDMYGSFLNKETDVNPLIFNFGQAVFKDADAFNKEDIACAWLTRHLQETCTTLYKEAHIHGHKLIFVGGSLCNRDFVRKLMTKAYTRVKLDLARRKEPEYEPELVFLKHGGHTGALGALVKSVEENNTTQ